ncbi:MAG: DUF2752 domain-containing protein [Lachnospiraceae bacterium]|nr:DUF2752 domain-containing protein [Lachnospiraceae bacterium]
MDKQWKYNLLIAGLLLFFALLSTLRLYSCPFERIFGIPCMLCGMTRALKSVLRLDLAAAFYYHPLWPLVILAAILCILKQLHLIHPSKRLVNAAVYTVGALLLICFVLRHIFGSPVVAPHFETSLLHDILTAAHLIHPH